MGAHVHSQGSGTGVPAQRRVRREPAATAVAHGGVLALLGRAAPGLLLAAGVVAAEPPTAPAAGASAGTRPRIGLVLGGGGARGAAHVGVLEVLERQGVPIDCVVGTSMGSIVGGLYAQGMSPAEIRDAMVAIDWDDIFSDEPPRSQKPFRRKRDDDAYLVKYRAGFDDGKLKLPLAVIQGQKFDLALLRLTARAENVHDFDRLPIPYRAVATGADGSAVVLKSGSLAKAIRASMAVPGVFDPVEIDGQMLFDGGVANNVPVDVARDLCADVVIAVDVGTGLLKQEDIKSVLSVVDQLTRILTVRNVEAQLATLTDRDLLIRPDLGDVTSSEFKRADEAIAAGRQAAEAVGPALSRLASAEGPARVQAQRRVESQPPVIGFVRIENHSRIGDDVIAAALAVAPGQPLDRAALEQQIGYLYGMELFERIDYDVVEENGQTGLVVRVREHSWGPKYLQFGIGLSDTFDGDATYNLGVSYLLTGLNRRAGEARVLGQIGEEPLAGLEWYQPLDVNLNWFVHPTFLFESANFSRYEDGDRIDEYQVTRYGGGLAVGRVIGRYGEVRVGLRRYSGEGEIQIGDPAAPDIDIEGGQAFVRARIDRLDNRNWPHQGYIGQFEWIESLESIGAAGDYSQARMNGAGVWTRGRNTLAAGFEVGMTVSGDATLDARFRTGGFTRLSGLAPNELSGTDYAVLRSVFYRRLGNIEWLPIYAGASLEYGNAYEDGIEFGDGLAAGSAFVGLDTILGPVYVGYGHAEQGNDSLYMYLGRLF